MYTAERTSLSDANLFFVADALGRAPFDVGRTGIRLPSVQAIISESCTKMLDDSVPLMLQRLAGKVFAKLIKAGHTGLRAHPLQPSLQSCFDVCTEKLRCRREYHDLAKGLRQACGELAWTKVSSGPYGSMNFGKSNAHAVIVGPGGVEDRADARIGVTTLGPYTRMPDHRLQCSRAYLGLTDFEFSTEDAGGQLPR